MKNTEEFDLSGIFADENKQRAWDHVLQQRFDVDTQIVEQVVVDEASRSGLYTVLKPEIDAFLEFFMAANTWKRLFVSSRLGILGEDFDDCPQDERRIRTMEFASEMSALVSNTFPIESEEYRRAMTGLGRIVEILVNWQSRALSSSIPKYRGSKIDGDPISFLNSHYASWIAGGRLNQLSLRKSDEKLLNAIKYELRKKDRSLSDLVPPGIDR